MIAHNISKKRLMFCLHYWQYSRIFGVIMIEIRHKDTNEVIYTHGGESLVGENLVGVCLDGASLRRANMVGVCLRGASMVGATFDNANLDGAGLDVANLVGATFDNASIRGARFVSANLRGTSMAGADLRGANFCIAMMDGVRFFGADIRGANFDGADLCGANFDGAVLDGAILDGAIIDGTSIDGAKLSLVSHDLVAEILRRAAGDDVEKRMIAGLVLLSRDWCWSRFEKIEHPQRQWAIDTLVKYLRDYNVGPSPRFLREHRTREHASDTQ
jgi:uncharacterized protein YjbI with pentapeptide repeats